MKIFYLQLEAETAYDTGLDEFSVLDYVKVQVLGLCHERRMETRMGRRLLETWKGERWRGS